MTERYRDIPENQMFARGNPDAGQAKTRGGASGRENRWRNPREARNPFSNNEEYPGSARENIRNLYTDRQQWLRSSGKSTLTEIRDLLRRQEISREIDEMAAVRAGVEERLNQKRAEVLAGAEDGEEKLTVGKLMVVILAALLSAPEDIAEQTAKDAEEQAKMAA